MGSIETRSGGKQIEEDISIKENSNVGFVAYNETVGTDAVDVLNQAIFNWKYCYGNAVLYGAEIDMNYLIKCMFLQYVKLLKKKINFLIWL